VKFVVNIREGNEGTLAARPRPVLRT